MFQFSLVGSLALLAVAMCWALAVVLFRVGQPGSEARRLSLLLVVESVTLVSTGYIDAFLTPSTQAHPFYPIWLKGEEIAHSLGDCAMLALYPAFLAAALRTRFTRLFEKKSVQYLIFGVSGLLFLAVLLLPLKIGATSLYVMLFSLFGFAMLASIQAWRHAAAGVARDRARAFAIAFGIRDLCWGFAYATAIVWIFSGSYQVADPDPSELPYYVYACGTLFAVPLIAYGILRAHLFDIDLRIRWTIKQSTVAAIIVTIIFVVSEGADRFLSAELGNFAGLLAAAVVVFFLAPLQRFGERIASAAMPNTRDTPEYLAYRKLQVYEAALIDARQGGVSPKERALLDTLRDSLEISPANAAALERDLEAQEIKGLA